jgi:hypothetical protein
LYDGLVAHIAGRLPFGTAFILAVRNGSTLRGGFGCVAVSGMPLGDIDETVVVPKVGKKLKIQDVARYLSPCNSVAGRP